MGKHGETLWHFANGRNTDALSPEPAENKGYSNSVTTAQDIVTVQNAHQVLLGLCETVSARMRRDNKCGSCITIHYRTTEFRHFSHQASLSVATNNTEYIYRMACSIFAEGWKDRIPLRQLGVQITKLSGQPYQQYDLFSGITPEQYERRMKLDETVDALRDKFGREIIVRGRFAKERVDSIPKMKDILPGTVRAE